MEYKKITGYLCDCGSEMSQTPVMNMHLIRVGDRLLYTRIPSVRCNSCFSSVYSNWAYRLFFFAPRIKTAPQWINASSIISWEEFLKLAYGIQTHNK